MANLNKWKTHRKGYLRAILQLGMRSRVFSEIVSGVDKSRLPTPERSCSFTSPSQVCFQGGDLKQVQFLKCADDLLRINESNN